MPYSRESNRIRKGYKAYPTIEELATEMKNNIRTNHSKEVLNTIKYINLNPNRPYHIQTEKVIENRNVHYDGLTIVDYYFLPAIFTYHFIKKSTGYYILEYYSITFKNEDTRYEYDCDPECYLVINNNYVGICFNFLHFTTEYEQSLFYADTNENEEEM